MQGRCRRYKCATPPAPAASEPSDPAALAMSAPGLKIPVSLVRFQGPGTSNSSGGSASRESADHQNQKARQTLQSDGPMMSAHFPQSLLCQETTLVCYRCATGCRHRDARQLSRSADEVLVGEAAVDEVHHPGGRVAQQLGDHGRVLALLHPGGEGPPQVIRAHPCDAGVDARRVQIAAHVAPGLHERARLHHQRPEFDRERLGDEHLSARLRRLQRHAQGREFLPDSLARRALVEAAVDVVPHIVERQRGELLLAEYTRTV